jgi:lipopolysaccharide biosynthesis glycosyltransferase
LTAQYWAYKNETAADYYGFWHYRRYFAFSDEVEDEWGVIPCQSLNEEALKRFQIDERHISEVVDTYDIVIPTEWECVEGGKKYTVYEHWCKHFQKEDLDLVIKLVLKRYPQYYDALMDVLYSDRAIFCNMFIMKKALFEEYSAFLFDILEEFEKESDHTRYNIEQYRTIGHIAERLLAVYVRRIEATRPETKVLYLSRVQFNDTRPYAVIKPLDVDKRSVAIVLACNDAYMCYTDVLLRSIADNANVDYHYDIVILHRGITERNRQIAQDIFSRNSNFTLRFADVTRNFEKYEHVHVDRHLTLETYYRFLVPDLFKDYDRVLYLDCDMVVNRDITELYFTDLEGYYAAVVRDIDFIAKCVESKEFFQKNILKHLKINDYFDYFQAGMILFNVPEIRKRFTSEKLFETALSHKWHFHDQDVLNHLLNGKVRYVDLKWNVFSLLEQGSDRSMLVKDYLAAGFAEGYREAVNNPYIVHFAGVPKPWDDLTVDLSPVFWKYARNSPYYESLLHNLLIGEGVRTSWFIFFKEKEGENTGVKFFRITNPGEAWSSILCVIDFVFCTGVDTSYTDTLFVNAQVYPHEQHGSWMTVKQFHWEKGAPIFTENIGFTIDNAKSITIWARYIGQFAGFSFTVRTLESRDIEKPKIVLENQHFIRETVELPSNIKYVTGGGGKGRGSTSNADVVETQANQLERAWN